VPGIHRVFWVLNSLCMIAGMAKPKFTNPDDFDFLVDMYMEDCKAHDKAMTHVGLALALGFSCRQSLYDYQAKELFTDSVKRARAMIEDWTVNKALKSNSAAAIFMLKNMGYTDKQTVVLDPITIHISGSDAKLG
jgi:hypothetical protein